MYNENTPKPNESSARKRVDGLDFIGQERGPKNVFNSVLKNHSTATGNEGLSAVWTRSWRVFARRWFKATTSRNFDFSSLFAFR